MLRNLDHVLNVLGSGIRNDKPVKDKTEGGHKSHLQSSESLCGLQRAERELGDGEYWETDFDLIAARTF